MPVRSNPSSSAQVLAVLGPTNTGKTHLAVERLLGHRSGMIGLPLRLLAREIYDRVVAARGARHVALITGEEKILPPHPSYFICTVESMPLDRRVAFLAVDEIQLAADPERGHVFTDRLLHARGESETLFLGSDTMRPLIRRLLPEAEFITRPRFSVLSHAGERKLTRLPRRTALVSFSAADVYALAELVRRQRGGAAVVLGALSPRTRNAQVALYQAGEVDYLVATDAIGMGLNMNVDHVAFAGLRKFDGRVMRRLTAAEIGQIAGRAGRHMNDGSFGTTAGAGAIPPETVEMVENHRFDPVRQAQWRNSELDYASLASLLHSLDAPPPRDALTRTREADDYVALKALAGDPAIAALAAGRAAVRRLWEACQIPDFRKSMPDVHHRLVRQIYRHLMGPAEVLPADWVAAQVARLDRTDGDIDTLAGRIAHIRTWTYVSHRADWMVDARHWQERARAIEDRLSDALHAALTQRFVDRRTAVLFRGLKEKRELFGAVTADGDLLVEGQYVGKLRGLTFTADTAGLGSEARAVTAAANRILSREIVNRAARLAQAEDHEIAWKEDNRLWWSGATVARLAPGPELLRPRIELLPTDHLSGPLAERVRQRLAAWVEAQIRRIMPPLFRLARAPLQGAARGLVFQLAETGGSLPREQVEPLLRSLSKADRATLRRHGVRLGYVDVFLPAMLKPERVALRACLFAVLHGLDATSAAPQGGVVSAPAGPDADAAFLQACGYRVFGARAVRIDMIDRLAAAAQEAARSGPFHPGREMASLVGMGRDELSGLLVALGYRASERDGHVVFTFAGRRKDTGSKAQRRRQSERRRASPFAKLARLTADGG